MQNLTKKGDKDFILGIAERAAVKQNQRPHRG